MSQKPAVKPENPCFSSGPCAKRPGWTINVLGDALVGRSHRSADAKARLKQAFDLTREVLQIPSDYKICMVEGSNTGAMEAMLWALLGENDRGIDMFFHERFGFLWDYDLRHLGLKNVRSFPAPYGELPDYSQADFNNDVVLVRNGTPSGVWTKSLDFVPDSNKREGLVFCDAVSALGACKPYWEKVDCMSFSWQKIFGSEAAHGVAVLSPKAYERLQRFRAPRAIPKIFRFRIEDEENIWEQLFEGFMPINTPSLLCLEDYLDALRWAKKEGNWQGLEKRTQKNFAVIQSWVQKNADHIKFLGKSMDLVSPFSPTILFCDEALTKEQNFDAAYFVAKLLQDEKVAFDIKGHEDAPKCLRIWTGPTIEAKDVEALTQWIDWAFEEFKKGL